jgi:SAM-dependent methyltransferase
MSPDPYSISAKYYDDAYAAKPELIDVPFYLEQARQTAGPVLEIACGTGRILLALARAGVRMHGVDKSPHMLRVLQERLSREPAEVRERVFVEPGDMREFRLSQRFPLVIIPFRPMQHMFTVPDQIKALQTAAFHLNDDGRLIFDVFFPKFEYIPDGIGQEVLELEWPLASEPGRIVRRYFLKEAYDKINQNFRATFIFRTYEGDKLVREETEEIRISYYTYPHLQALLLLAGLEVVEEYGSFQKAPLDNQATEMVFVLKKKQE